MKTFIISFKNYIGLILLIFLNLSCGFVNKVDFNVNHKLSPLLTGLDVLEKNQFNELKGKRIGLITNQTGVNKNLVQNIKLFMNSKNVDLRAIFTPEHGLFGSVTAGKKINSDGDKLFGFPIYSLYGDSKKPTADMLKDLDLIIFDIQDIGIRSYTYISTMGLAMEAAAENKIEFMVLDRPNPLGLKKVEGNILDINFQSFIGKYPLPYVYGLSCGELAIMINESGWIGTDKCKLTVIKMENIYREIDPESIYKNWVPTSPHVPLLSSPYYMVSTGILGELGVFSIGVGYTLPFRTIAAPWIDHDLLSDELNLLGLKGVIFRPIQYSPYYGIYEGQQVQGVQVFITNKKLADLITIQFYFLEVHNRLYPHKNPFKIASKEEVDMFDKALGTDTIRKVFSDSFDVRSIKNNLLPELENYIIMAKKYYLYD